MATPKDYQYYSEDIKIEEHSVDDEITSLNEIDDWIRTIKQECSNYMENIQTEFPPHNNNLFIPPQRRKVTY